MRLAGKWFPELDGAWPSLEGKLRFGKQRVKKGIADKRESTQEDKLYNMNILNILEFPLWCSRNESHCHP